MRTTGTETSFHFNAYVAENRQYDGYDRSLRTAYNFGFLNTRPDWVEHYPYQDGAADQLLGRAFNDNNVGDHPGGGLILPVDAHPSPQHWADGQFMRQRIQSVRLDVRAREDRPDHAALEQRADDDPLEAGGATV